MSSNEEEENCEGLEGLFDAFQYLVICVMGDLVDARDHLGNSDGNLAKESIISIKKNLELLEGVAHSFIDIENSQEEDVNINDEKESVIDCVEEGMEE